MNETKIGRKSFISKTAKSIIAVSLLAVIPFKLFGREIRKVKVVINKDAVKRKK